MGVVAIGASAGGLRPLQALFAAIPEDTGLAFIVVQHLSPDFDSVMDMLIAKHTSMPIHFIESGMELAPNTVYLNPPRFNAEIVDLRFQLHEFDRSTLRLPINTMFRSIADEYGSASVAVVLSGTGSDGAKGLVAVHEAGGLTVVQSLESVEFDGMPRSALATNVVDFTKSPSDIANVLVEHVRNRLVRPETESAPEESPAVEHNKASSIRLIFSLLSTRYGIDFAHYKPTTVARRIDRRLQLSRHGSLQAYAKVLGESPAELDLLYHDLLIGVTHFFRDGQAFQLLADEMSKKIARLPPGEELRVWSAGCASGEEAYSLAMMLTTIFDKFQRPPLFKIFATDVHDRSLDHASRGIYQTEHIQGLTPAQMRLFFLPHGSDRSKVVPSLRHHIVFARQNLVNDPPFTRIDLVLCRNLLIYLQEDIQAIAIAGFHFALKEDGLMMLGPSETAGPLAVGFNVIDKYWRFFSKNNTEAANHLFRQTAAKYQKKASDVTTLQLVEAEGNTVRMSATSHQLLAQYLGDAVLLDAQKRIQQVFGNPRFFLNAGAVRAGVALVECVPERHRPVIEALIADAKQSLGREVRVNDLTNADDPFSAMTDVTAKRFASSAVESEIIVLQFFPQSTSESFGARGGNSDGDPLDGNSLDQNFGNVSTLASTDQGDFRSQLTNFLPNQTNELTSTREDLNSVVEQLRATNEELHSANEEMIASNEELQSTNEELQSVNEELQTVNQEHQMKVLELEEMTDDFNNLFNSTAVGSILLDRDLCIRKFTRSATDYFRLMEHDIGRPLSNFATQIVIDNLSQKVCQVLESGQPFSAYVQDARKKWLSMDITPYYASNQIAGVIINLLDLTTLIHATADCTGEMVMRPQSNLWQWTRENDQVWLSPQLCKFLGLSSTGCDVSPQDTQSDHAPTRVENAMSWDQFQSLFICHDNLMLTPSLLESRQDKRLLRISRKNQNSDQGPLDLRWISQTDSSGVLQAITGSIENGINHG